MKTDPNLAARILELRERFPQASPWFLLRNLGAADFSNENFRGHKAEQPPKKPCKKN